LYIELVCATITPMFEALAGVIEATEVPVTGAAIAEARRLLDLLDAKITEAEATYASIAQFQVEGFPDMATFERHACRSTLPESRRIAGRAARVAAWPELGQAWRDGTLTGAQVALACAIVPNHHVERFAETMAATIELVAPLTAHQTGVVLRRAVEAADAFAEREAAEAGIEPVDRAPDRELSAARSLDDELVIRGHVDRDSAAVIEKALTAATRDDVEGERRTPMERRADALVAVCQGFLDSLENPDGNRRTERLTFTADITVLHRAWLRGAGVITAEDLEQFLASRPHLGELDRGLFLDAFDGTALVASTLDGRPVTDGLVGAVAEGGAMELLLTSGSRLLDLGRTVRHFTAAQRRAILVRDGGCRTCGTPPERCDVHHVVPWEEGGTTDVGNGVAKCRRCHLEHHRKKWVDHLDPDGTYRVTRPDGTEIATRPAGLDDQLPILPVATTSEPARPLRQRQDASSVEPVEQVGDCYGDPHVIEALDELIKLRVRHGDDDERTIRARDEAWERIAEFDRAACTGQSLSGAVRAGPRELRRRRRAPAG
jgi:hypothetical protein